MIKDLYKSLSESALNHIASFLFKDNASPYKGEVFWELCDTKTGGTTSGHLKNIVTRDASILIARLVKSTITPNVSEPAFGIYALAVGTGDAGWDPQYPPKANKDQRSLYNEIARKTFSSVSYIDSLGNPSANPTNVIDFTTIFSESEAVGPLTEMMLLGGDVSTNMSERNPVLPPNGPYDATVDLVGKDTAFNYLTFPVINKPFGSTFSWVWRITL